jgi:hypothetical protein
MSLILLKLFFPNETILLKLLFNKSRICFCVINLYLFLLTNEEIQDMDELKDQEKNNLIEFLQTYKVNEIKKIDNSILDKSNEKKKKNIQKKKK